MQKTRVYIKKLIALLVVIATGFFLSNYFSYYFVIPFCFFTLAFLYWRITGDRPFYLFGLSQANQYLEARGGFWLLFKWLFGFGILYDILAMIFNGVYQLFLIISDILWLITTILYWIIYAIIWFFSLFIPPLVFIFKMIVHYIFKWPWWIFKLCYRNTSLSINRNFYRVTFRGAVLAILIFLLIWGAGIITNMRALSIFGIIIASLPVIWTFGAVSYIRRYHLVESTEIISQRPYNAGLSSIRVMVVYLTFFFLFLLAEIALNLLGWIPEFGFALLGISLNMNTLLTILLLFLGVILLFAVMILPPHIVSRGDPKHILNETILLMGVIAKKFLRYLAALIPLSIFSAILLIIPAVIISLAVFLTISLRDKVLDTRIEMLKAKEIYSNSQEKVEIGNNIKLLQFYKTYPQNILEFAGIKNLSLHVRNQTNNLQKANNDILIMEAEYSHRTDSLENIVALLSNSSDTIVDLEIRSTNNAIKSNAANYESKRNIKLDLISELKADIAFSKSIIYQLPLVFFLTAIWISFFGGIILCVILSYFGNVFYELYVFREDGRITYFRQTAQNINKKDNNQPLLGFTLLIIGFLVLLYFLYFYNLIG